jgi:Holliday junction resolvasome RuvABC endonuclease subunit
VRKDYENTNDYPQEHAHKYQLFYQLTRITKERGALAKDDRLDALAMAVAYWVEQMDKDVQHNEKEHRDRALQDELDRFVTQVLGAPQVTSSWMTL